MAAGRSSFTKRQKEHARLQKRQDKAEKKKNRIDNKSEESDFATNDDFQMNHDGQLENVSIESLLPPMKERAQ
jgi:hypothetical protein